MKKSSLIFLIVACGCLITSCTSKKQQEVNIIPQPVSMQIAEGSFTLTPQTSINVVKGANDLAPACTFFSKLVEGSFGCPLTVTEGEAQSGAINIQVDPSLKKEAYLLNVSDKSVDIKGGSSQAVFYAFQSLRQMMPAGIEKGDKTSSIELQNVNIADEPRFAYRGMMLDVCRHIFTPDSVKMFIDMLAMHKLNRFHWHLTDDQGWRIEIKKYPELTQSGSQRKETVIGKNTGKYDGKPYGGYFTQDQIKDIVKYAADRYITVIPEIELPGHAVAALTSYPSLGCKGGPYEVMKEWGISDEVFCAGNDKTFEFLQNVLDEVIPLFPSEYIHIGGDECPKTAWKKCPKCQARIKKEKLKNEYELQSYFVHRIENYVNSKGKKIIGWDEILEGGISKTATIMSWRGTKGGIEAAKLGNEVIMAPNNYVYFDYYQSRDIANEPFGIGGYVPVEKVYSLNPTQGLSAEEAKMVKGVQANMWSEYIKTFSHAQYMTLPRMAALSEVAWTPNEQKNYNCFVKRAFTLTDRYEALGYNYAKHILAVNGETATDSVNNRVKLTLFPQPAGVEIRYTTDGSTPDLNAPLYTNPVDLTGNCEVKAQMFRNGKAVGKEFHQKIELKKEEDIARK